MSICSQFHFVVEGDSLQLSYTEARLKERLIFQRCADMGVDDGGDKMVTIKNRFVTRGSHREFVFALITIDGVDIRIVPFCGCVTQTET